MFLIIENAGECPIESFTILGLSTSRENKDKIGQFGSGAKHAVNLLLRKNVNLQIFSGNNEISFFTKPKRMQDRNFQLVCARINSKTQDLGFCLEFGEMDWDTEWMAFRELVSNALDASENPNDVKIEVVDKCEGKEGCTRIFIPLTSEIQKCYNELYDKFLHFDDRINKKLIKRKPINAKIYRQGVFVRELNIKSLFDYNFGSDLKVDECRNLDMSDCKARCANLFAVSDKDCKKEVLRSLIKPKVEYLEHKFSYYSMSFNAYGDKKKIEWVKIWNEVSGNAIIYSDSNIQLISVLGDKAKNINMVNLPNSWYQFLEYCGVSTIFSLLNEVEQEGYKVCNATIEIKESLDDCWHVFRSVDLTMDKDKPEVKGFTAVSQGNKELYGFYKNGMVYINVDHSNIQQTMYEELIHYISGAKDSTRDFQEFSLKLVTRIANNMIEIEKVCV